MSRRSSRSLTDSNAFRQFLSFSTIFELSGHTLALFDQAGNGLAGKYYRDLPSAVSDAFDDFEIEYDEISDADETEIKSFFQRLQQGLPLTSSEKLNAVHSKLRD